MKFLLLSYWILFSSNTFASANTDKEKQAIKATTLSWQTAYDSRELSRILALYDSSASFWGTTAKSVASTPVQIKKYFSKSVKRKSSRVTIDEQHVRVYDDFATNTGKYTFTITIDGQSKDYPARFSFVFKKKGAKWVIIQHHSSQLPK